ncbi:hypothetical protein GCM10010129_40020 [Streptomyces fumigatiscleroticus]|nr:hypothetical protein GCM10010129_40020 [Streptomyces fumigatiscleroticus]
MVASSPVPSAAAWSTFRISPVARETTVPAAISADERSTPPVLGAACLLRSVRDPSKCSGDVLSIMGTIYDPRLRRLAGTFDSGVAAQRSGATSSITRSPSSISPVSEKPRDR